MTEQEMAEKYAKGLCSTCRMKVCRQSTILTCSIKEALKLTYLEAYKEGKPKWHKVSELIPTEEKSYLVKLTDGTVDVMTIALDGNLEPYLLLPGFDFYKDVEKWCEIPEE